MIDERAEFAAYTGVVVYDATNKQDSAYLGRFTFDTLLRGEGLQRILTIVARGYLWQTEKPDIDRARDALRAWCSIPDSKKAKPKEAWQYEDMARQLSVAYRQAAQENHALLAEVGQRFYDLSPTHPLYAADGVHPNEEGTQLAAEVLAETILTHKEFTP